MKRPIVFFVGFALLFVAVAMPLAGQSLLDNEFYHKAQDLLSRSQKSLDQGDYDAAASFAAQARDSLSKSDDYVATMLLFYRANGYLSAAKDRVTYAKSIDADVNYKDAYTTGRMRKLPWTARIIPRASICRSPRSRRWRMWRRSSRSRPRRLSHPCRYLLQPRRFRSIMLFSSSSPCVIVFGGLRHTPSCTTIRGNGNCCMRRTRVFLPMRGIRTSSSRA